MKLDTKSTFKKGDFLQGYLRMYSFLCEDLFDFNLDLVLSVFSVDNDVEHLIHMNVPKVILSHLSGQQEKWHLEL